MRATLAMVTTLATSNTGATLTTVAILPILSILYKPIAFCFSDYAYIKAPSLLNLKGKLPICLRVFYENGKLVPGQKNNF